MAEVQTHKIRTNCSNCGAEYVVFNSLNGKQVRCVKCQAPFTVSASEANPAQTTPGPPAQRQTRPGEPVPGQALPTPNAPGPQAAAAALSAATSPPPAREGKIPVDRHLEWLADNMTEIVCPHCRLVYPASKAFIGQYMACPRCRQKFLLSPSGHAVDHQTPFERFMEDKTAVKTVAAAAIVLVLVALIGLFLSSSRKSYLIGSLRATYTMPNYELSLIDPPRVHYTHKVNDGSRECPAVAYVHVAHPGTGMEFDRMLCRVDGTWSPTYYQRLLDEAAVRYLDDLETGRMDYSSGFDDMVDKMFGREAANYAEMYNRIPEAFNEEEMLKKASISAFERLTHGNDWADFMAETYYNEAEDEDEDFEYPSYRERYYLAHAVVYPDQAGELFRKKLIKELP